MQNKFKKKIVAFTAFILSGLTSLLSQTGTDTLFPNGSPIPPWFSDSTKITLNHLGKPFVITDYGAVNDSLVVQTATIQNTIDKAFLQGGGVIVIPKGVFLSGALFFKPKTALYLSEGAVLKGSDTIANYPKMPSRMEGQNLDYYPALVNAYGVDHFSISGKGTINGNGSKYWKAFWQRRKENPNCTNLEVSRPRLVFIQNSDNVQLQDVKLINSGFWTSHFYKCNNVKLLNLYIYSPRKPVKAPSTDAIDIDACTNVLIKGCYLSVNDDAIALKGGKGPLADKDPANGANKNIIIENCEFGFCHSALTCGSESIHDRNIIMRNCHIDKAMRLLWLKMRGDTQQTYEYITLENITGQAHSFIYIKPWSQFFDLKGQTAIPISTGEHVIMKNIELKCNIFFNVQTNDNNRLSHFLFENLSIEAKNGAVDKSLVQDFRIKNVMVNGVLTE
ncbi:MAG TPA: glycosyl hydrolase family 28 protein [Flavobacteriaceae bacterium]|nr:glycosyl hydrolase family 28 protein [Flavobacteriaceae bacterium]